MLTPPERPAPPPRPGFGDAILLLIVMACAGLVALFAIYLGARDAELDIFLLGIVEICALFFALLVGVRWSRAPIGEVLLLRRTPIGYSLAAIPMAVAAAFLTALIETPIRWIVPIPSEVEYHMATLLYAETGADWLRVIGIVVLLIPFGEELLFRGLFLRGFVLRYGRGRALALTALLFALVHFNPWGLPAIFGMGWLLGWLLLRAGSLWPAFCAHAAFNLTSVLGLNLSISGPLTRSAVAELEQGWSTHPLTLFAAALIMMGMIALIAQRGPRELPWKPPSEEPPVLQ